MEAKVQCLPERDFAMVTKRPALPARWMPRSIAHLVRRQIPFQDPLTKPGNLVTMMTTGRTGRLSDPVPKKNGCGSGEHFFHRPPSLLPVLGFGSQVVDATRPVGRQRKQVHDFDFAVAKKVGRLRDPAASPGSGRGRWIGENADEHAVCSRQRHRGLLPNSLWRVVKRERRDVVMHASMLPEPVPCSQWLTRAR